ncbi:MAG TPA: circularly permuted type 2 ATP-grasp protein, partial [Methylomirabilota bacterium]|nr:circularly permuted type 2 ATP-grasp protein [Methylomirabilota bacterium]
MFGDYDAKSFFDEVFEPDGTPRPHYADIVKRIRSLSPVEFGRRRALADLTFRNQGITFTVYGDESGTERTFPFDLLPRVIPAAEWATIE